MSIEYLKTAYADAKIEKAKPINNWKKYYLRLRFGTLGVLFPCAATEFAYKLFATPRSRAKHWKTDAVIDSALVSDLIFDNLKIKVYEWGTGDKIVLLVHGWESRGTALRMFVNPLLKSGFKIVTFDAPAHGDSEGEILNLPTNARVIAEVMKKFGGAFKGAIAHSFGCSSIIFALQHINPDLSIEHVVLLAVPPRLEIILKGFMNRVRAPEKLRQYIFKKIHGIHPKLENFDAALSEDKVHVKKLLLVHDLQDDVTPIKTAEDFEKKWKNAYLLITQGLGHYRLVKNPDVVRFIIDFICSAI